MKIIFDSAKEKKMFIDNLKNCAICPQRIGLQNCCQNSKDCYECWDKAIESEVKER